jgi:hypothetical protein
MSDMVDRILTTGWFEQFEPKPKSNPGEPVQSVFAARARNNMPMVLVDGNEQVPQ